MIHTTLSLRSYPKTEIMGNQIIYRNEKKKTIFHFVVCIFPRFHCAIYCQELFWMEDFPHARTKKKLSPDNRLIHLYSQCADTFPLFDEHRQFAGEKKIINKIAVGVPCACAYKHKMMMITSSHSQHNLYALIFALHCVSLSSFVVSICLCLFYVDSEL